MEKSFPLATKKEEVSVNDFIVIKAAESKLVKQEFSCTVIISPYKASEYSLP